MDKPRNWMSFLNSETMRAATMECPPKSRKKWSSIDTGFGANNASHTVAILFSNSVRAAIGPTLGLVGRARGGGSLLRSTLPLGKVGSSDRTSTTAGIM